MKSSSSILIFAILICASFLCLYNLGAQPLHNDEARYAEIVTESFITGNHQFALYYRDQPYFNKTPLLFWFVDAAHVFDRDLQTDVRLPSAVCAILLVAAVMLIVFEITSNVYTTAVAGIILTTTASFIFLVRSGRFDSLATLALALATYSLLKASRDKRWFLLWGGALGIAFMAKGPIVVFAIVASIPILFLNLTWKTLWKEKFIWGAIAIALLIVLPWHIYETILYGATFWNEYLLQQVIGRIQTNIVSVALPLSNQNYATYFFEYLAPWSILFLGSIVVFSFIHKEISRDKKVLLYASYAEIGSVLLVSILVQSKAYRYLLPLYPFMAIALALVAEEIWRSAMQQLRKSYVSLFVVLTVGALWWTIYNAFLFNNSYPYSTDTPVSAVDERAVATILTQQNAKTFYVYNTADIGGIMYYSHLINPYYFPKQGYYPGAFFVLPTQELPSFVNDHQHLSFSIAYSGADLTLGQERGEALECYMSPYCGL